MSYADEIRSLSTHFPSGLKPSQFDEEIVQNTVITTALHGTIVQGDVVTIRFYASLSGPESTELTNLAAAHVPETDSNVESNIITEPLTAFGEVLTNNLVQIIGEAFPYGIIPARLNTTVTGSGSVSMLNSNAVISTGTTVGSTAVMATKRILHYTPGVGVDARFTAIFENPASDGYAWIGLGTANIGIFFGYSGSTFGIIRKFDTGTTEFVPQASWNVNTFSGMDKTKGNIFRISMQYLGYGAIQCFIEDPTTGKFSKVHVFNYANANTQPTLRNLNLPIGVYVSNGTTTNNTTIRTASIGGFLQGPETTRDPIFSRYGQTSGSGATTVLSIRNDTTFGGITNGSEISIQYISLAVEGTKPVRADVILNASISGASWTAIDATNSCTSYDISGTATGGRIITSFFLGKSASTAADPRDRLFLEPGDTLTMLMTPVSGTSDMTASFTWDEKH